LLGGGLRVPRPNDGGIRVGRDDGGSPREDPSFEAWYIRDGDRRGVLCVRHTEPISAYKKR